MVAGGASTAADRYRHSYQVHDPVVLVPCPGEWRQSSPVTALRHLPVAMPHWQAARARVEYAPGCRTFSIRSGGRKKILFLPHAVKPMARPASMISPAEGKIIEDYPEDVRGLSDPSQWTPDSRRRAR